MKEGPGRGTKCHPRRETWHDLKPGKSPGRTAIRDSSSFSAALSNGAQANKLLASPLHGTRWCICGQLVEASRAGVARRGHLSQRGRAAASSLDTLMYPSEAGRRTRYGRYVCTLSVFTPTKSKVYIYDLTPVELLDLVATLPSSAPAYPSVVLFTPCTNYHCLSPALSSSS